MAGIQVFVPGTPVDSAPYRAFGAGRQSQAPAMAKDQPEIDSEKPVARTKSRNPKRRLRSVVHDVLNSAT